VGAGALDVSRARSPLGNTRAARRRSSETRTSSLAHRFICFVLATEGGQSFALTLGRRPPFVSLADAVLFTKSLLGQALSRQVAGWRLGSAPLRSAATRARQQREQKAGTSTSWGASRWFFHDVRASNFIRIGALAIGDDGSSSTFLHRLSRLGERDSRSRRFHRRNRRASVRQTAPTNANVGQKREVQKVLRPGARRPNRLQISSSRSTPKEKKSKNGERSSSSPAVHLESPRQNGSRKQPASGRPSANQVADSGVKAL